MTAPVVERIFVMRAAGQSLASIAATLAVEGVPCPSAHDPERNSHRTGATWSSGSIRAILHNPSYTGARAWGKQEKVERLVDVNDIALGYATTMRRRDKSEWITPATPTHQALVSVELFQAAHSADPSVEARSQPRLYPLSGHLRCAHCDNLMAATFTRTNRESDVGRAYYRCETGKKATGGGTIADHPRSVLVSQARLLHALDSELIARFCDVRDLAEQLTRASKPDAEITATRRRIAQLGAELNAMHSGVLDQDHASELMEQRTRLSATRDRYCRHLDDLRWAVVKPSDRSIGEGIARLKVQIDRLLATSDTERRAIYAQARLTVSYEASSRNAHCTIEPLALVVGPTGRPRYPGLRHDFSLPVPKH